MPEEVEPAKDDEEIDAAPEADRPKRKKKKPTHRLSHKEPPAEAKRAVKEDENLVYMPQAWVDCQTIMSWWLLITFLVVGLSIVTIPIGCILAFVACFMYFSVRGTEEEFGGKHISRVIYIIALVAWGYDMIIFALTLFAWVILVYGQFEDYDAVILDFWVSVGYFVAAQMCMTFVHACLSFYAFLKVRDCCMDIILDEVEAKERFKNMEKQIYEEFRKKRKEDLTKKKSKKSKKPESSHD